MDPRYFRHKLGDETVTENTLKACFLGLMAVVVVSLAVLVALGKDSAVTDGLMAVCGATGALGVWERLKKN
jgi:hypothetical protein